MEAASTSISRISVPFLPFRPYLTLAFKEIAVCGLAHITLKRGTSSVLDLPLCLRSFMFHMKHHFSFTALRQAGGVHAAYVSERASRENVKLNRVMLAAAY